MPVDNTAPSDSAVTFATFGGIRRGDLDAFFGLFLNNLIDILLLTNLCLFALGFGTDLVFEKVLPGLALGVLIGNLWFFREARNSSARQPRRSRVRTTLRGQSAADLSLHVLRDVSGPTVRARAGHECRPGE